MWSAPSGVKNAGKRFSCRGRVLRAFGSAIEIEAAMTA